MTYQSIMINDEPSFLVLIGRDSLIPLGIIVVLINSNANHSIIPQDKMREILSAIVSEFDLEPEHTLWYRYYPEQDSNRGNFEEIKVDWKFGAILESTSEPVETTYGFNLLARLTDRKSVV